MSAAPLENQANPSAPVVQDPPTAPNGQASNPAPDAAELQRRVEATAAKNAELLAELKKIKERDKERDDATKAEKAAFEAKLREQGDHLKLYEIEKEKRAEAEARLAGLVPKAEAYSAFEARAKEEIAKAKEAGALPEYLVSLIDSVDPVRAVDALNKFRAAQASTQPAPKQPAPPAPAQGAAPPTPGPSVNLTNPSVADLQRLKASDPVAYARLINGSNATAPSLSFGARLTGAFRK